jgi:hypothetical protein
LENQSFARLEAVRQGKVMLGRLLKPNMASRGRLDSFVLAVSGLWLLGGIGEMIYFSLNPPDYRFGGPGFVDGSGGWAVTTVGLIFDLLLIVTFAISLCRVMYRAKHQ